jgi:putative ABC transport system substrate-binding protein
MVAAAAGWPIAAHAQRGGNARIPKVGVLWHAANVEEEKDFLIVVTKAFRDLGYVEGKTIELAHRFPAEQPDKFRAMARELVDSKVDVILSATGLGAKEAMQATGTIPIVFVLEPDPVKYGLVEGLARPGGNVTGFSIMGPDLTGKRLGFFRESVPKLSSLAILVDSRDPTGPRILALHEKLSKPLGISVQTVEVTTPDQIEHAFSTIAKDDFDGAIVTGAMLFNERVRVGASALAHKVPTVAFVSEMVPYGLLLSYGPDFADQFRKAVGYVDKILKGARPADLPVEQPTHFKLVVNQKTAKILGLTIPPLLLMTADEVIE